MSAKGEHDKEIKEENYSSMINKGDINVNDCVEIATDYWKGKH